MENETLDQQADRIAKRIIEVAGQTNFQRDDEPSPELQQLIVQKLNANGYKAEFYRLPNEPLGIMRSKILEDE